MKNSFLLLRQVWTALNYWNTWQFWLAFHPEIEYGGVIWIDWAAAMRVAGCIREARK